MPDEVREYIRAAQQAELRGDKPQAVELLKKAAAMVRSGGNFARALQLLRHAQRLDGDQQPELADEIRRLEWLPDKPFLRAVEDDVEEEAALAPLRDLEGDAPKIVERGPTRAPPELAAWCSFCCRPRNEVGALVAGPAGAFICATCVRESMKLLDVAPEVLPTALVAVGAAQAASATEAAAHMAGATPVPMPVPTEPREFMNPAELFQEEEDGPAAKAASAELVGQTEAMELFQRAMELELGWILITGPEGCGKTAFLKALERRGLGKYLPTPAGLLEPWGDERLLVDGLDTASPADRMILGEALGRAGSRAVIAVRSSGLPTPLMALSEAGEIPIYSTRDLSAACGPALPLPVAEKIQLAVALRALTQEELVEIARRTMVSRASELDLADELLSAIASEAFRSPRGAHELKALLDRVPAGSWSLKSSNKPPPSRKRRGKKTDPPAGP